MSRSAPPLIGRTVADVLVRHPKTLPADTTVDQARACFADDHVHMLLLTESGRLLGTLVRSDVPPSLDGTAPALAHSRLAGRTIAADTPVDQARTLLTTREQRRLAVIDDHGILLGLLCLKRRLTGFCTDTDIAARAADHRSGPAQPFRLVATSPRRPPVAGVS